MKMLVSTLILILVLSVSNLSRRRFMDYCAAMTTTLALPSSYAQLIANALSQKRKPVLVWLEFALLAYATFDNGTRTICVSQGSLWCSAGNGDADVGRSSRHYREVIAIFTLQAPN
jgi:hypothetical protein